MDTQDTNHGKDISRGGKKITTGDMITAIGSCVVVFSFFLPWTSSYTLGIRIHSGSGFSHALIATSKSSGLPGWPYFATLVAGLLSLALVALYIKRKHIPKIFPIAQVAFAIVGLLPFIYLMIETGHWTMIAVTRFGLWTSILGLIGIIVGAVSNIVKTKTQSRN